MDVLDPIPVPSPAEAGDLLGPDRLGGTRPGVVRTAQGFTVVNADARGCGHSDGTGKLLSLQEAQDTYDLVPVDSRPTRRATVGSSCSGCRTWPSASTPSPPCSHRPLRAICPWEGFSDAYRDLHVPGGFRETGFPGLWPASCVAPRARSTTCCRCRTNTRCGTTSGARSHPTYQAINAPMLVCGSFSDNSLHSRGSMRTFTHSNFAHARLYTHRSGKWETFYSRRPRGPNS